jgi:hypothetical protein
MVYTWYKDGAKLVRRKKKEIWITQEIDVNLKNNLTIT